MRALWLAFMPLAACSIELDGLDSLGGGGGDRRDGGPNDPTRDGSLPPDSIDSETYCTETFELEIRRRKECRNFDEDYSRRLLTDLGFLDGCLAKARRLNYVYDGAAAATCLEIRGAEDCDQYFYPWHFGQVTSCAGVFKGAAARGSRCTELDECGAGLVCDVGPPLGRCSHTCVPSTGTKRERQSCSTIYDCVDGLECPKTVVPARACMRHPEEGDACVAAGEADVCSPGVYCSSLTDRCQRVHQLGERCTLDVQCAPGMACAGLQDEEVCVWQAPITGDCSFGQGGCVPGAFCARGNWCAQMPIAGDWCGGEDSPRCHPGLACVDGICRLPLSDGAGCTENEQCRSGRCGSQWVCEAGCE